MNKDQVKGRAKEVTGKVKEVTGRIVGNEKLEGKGKIQQAAGKVQADYGDLKEDLKEDMDGDSR
ncbi:general stress protein CsbD [Ectothiorhodospira shaposhnikovii]|nr:CsbD family protein [Ectothiorhodospira shaposhnikovii]MBK1672453.1 general stress protein CsbD [Ectothiorhodospira shaposhnikovii]